MSSSRVGVRGEDGNRTNSGPVTILFSQINLHHCLPATMSINDWFARAGGLTTLQPSLREAVLPKIALIQEPYQYKGKVKDISKDIVIFSGDSKEKVRACIVTTKNVEAWILNQFTNEDQVTIGMRWGNSFLAVASTYMPYDSELPPPPALLKDLIKHCKEKNWQLIVGTDANSHNVVWGSTDNNQRGESLLDYIMSSHMHICNVGNKPTFTNAIRSEVIDITLATAGIDHAMQGWKVSNQETFSDHKRIEFSLTGEASEPAIYRNVRKTDWTLFNYKLENNLNWHITGTESIEEITGKLTNSIINAYNDSCKQVKCNKTRKPPWWTRELTALKREAQKFKRRYSRNPTEENSVDKKNALRNYTREVHRAKRKHWQCFCEEMLDLSATARISKILKTNGNKKMGSILDSRTGLYSNTPEESLRILLDTHFADPPPGEQVLLENQEVDLEVLESTGNRIFNREALKAAFSSFLPYKSPGRDGIYPIFIQKGIDILEEKLLFLYKKSFKEGKIPQQWTESKVVFLPKPAKDDYTDPKSYRPLSLTSFLLKGMERMILWEVQGKIEKNSPLHSNLFSYREGKSTEDAIHKVVHKIEKAITTNKIAVGMFLDIEAAFNNATVSGMKYVLEKKGVDNSILNWIVHTLKNRTAFAEQNSFLVSKTVRRGCPQGGILSPFIWNLIMDDLLNMFPKIHPTDVTVYADDLTIVGTGIDENTVVANLKSDVKRLQDWTARHSLSFSPSKTKLILFSRRKVKVKPEIKMNDTVIKWVDDTKFLGMILDSQLRWNLQVEKTLAKATWKSIQCRKLLDRQWGLKPKVMHWLYIAIIRPLISYGALAWAPKLDEKNTVKKLSKLQRLACLMITNAQASTPTAGMETILSIRPLHIYLKEVAVSSQVRMMRQGTWLARDGEAGTGHGKTVMAWTRQIPELSMPSDKLKNKVRLCKNFGTVIADRDDIPISDGRPMPEDINTINCFTDGSKSGDKSGAGFLIKGNQVKIQGFFHLGKYTTVFQAEIMAVLAATERLLEHKIENKTIRIKVDSQSAIRALGQFTIDSSLVLQCKSQLNKLGQMNQVTVQWIPGHQDYKGNEVADRLAKAGTEMTNDEGPTPRIPVTKQLSRQLIKEWGLKMHNREWKQRNDCRQTKMFMPEVKSKPKLGILTASRGKTRKVMQLLTGHNNLERHRFLMKMTDSPMCRKCGLGEETAEHYITECPAYREKRMKNLGGHTLDRKELPNLKLKYILDFANDTGRLDEPTVQEVDQEVR